MLKSISLWVTLMKLAICLHFSAPKNRPVICLKFVSYYRSTKLVRSLRLARLVRLIRLLKIPDFMEEWEDNSPLGPSSVKLGRLLILMAFSAHINACIW